ncbi:hypothetical protein A2U01_0064055, partial [Trifolium medium]|nr:hypothetical protein [Trifolium medium]
AACTPAACPDSAQPVATLSSAAASRLANLPIPPNFVAPCLDPYPPTVHAQSTKEKTGTDGRGDGRRPPSIAIALSRSSW